jgi:hypothetical protein
LVAMTKLYWSINPKKGFSFQVRNTPYRDGNIGPMKHAAPESPDWIAYPSKGKLLVLKLD